MRGLRLGLSLTGSSSFTPASLFAGAPSGMWYDVSDLSSMYQDSTGTTTPAVVGQPVGYIRDKSGNSNHLIQATTSLKPILQQDGNGNYYLLFDGVDDYLACTTGALTQPYDRLSAIQQVAWGSNLWIFSGNASATAGRLLQAGTTPQINITNDGTSSITSGGLAVGSNGVVTERHNGASSQIAINNGAYTTGSVGTGSPTGIVIGARGDAKTSCSNIRLYGMFQRAGTLTAAEIASLRTYLGAKAGLVL